MKSHINVRNVVVALTALGLTLLPVYSALTGNSVRPSATSATTTLRTLM